MHKQTRDYLARIAVDILFSDKYMDLLKSVYSERETVVEIETKSKNFLMHHDIGIPDGVDVVVHDPDTLGKPARVDFHWEDSIQTFPPKGSFHPTRPAINGDRRCAALTIDCWLAQRGV